MPPLAGNYELFISDALRYCKPSFSDSSCDKEDIDKLLFCSTMEHLNACVGLKILVLVFLALF